MLIFDDNKVARFWKNEFLLEKYKDNEIVIKICDLKTRCLEKLDNDEWNNNDYNLFTKFVRKIKVSKFSDFYDLLVLYMDLSNEELKTEIDKLNELSFIKSVSKTNNSTELMINSIYQFYTQILRLAVIYTDDVSNFTVDEKINIYKDILEQLHDKNSDYCMVLLELYKELVNNAVHDEKLKQKILDLDNIILNSKIYRIKYFLSVANQEKERNKNKELNSYIGDIEIKKHIRIRGR